VLTRPGCRINRLAEIGDDLHSAMLALAEALGATSSAPAHVAPLARPALPHGDMTLENIGQALGALLPEQAIVVDEAVTSGRGFPVPTAHAAPHDWLSSMGGSIGFGMPCAVGAAVACPDRKVVCLEGDGSGMYMPQTLWTMAREGLDILTLIFANRKYQILRNEMANVGVSNIGPKASALLDIDNPTIDWVSQARTFGVAAWRAETVDELARHMTASLAEKGPRLIEVVM